MNDNQTPRWLCDYVGWGWIDTSDQKRYERPSIYIKEKDNGIR